MLRTIIAPRKRKRSTNDILQTKRLNGVADWVERVQETYDGDADVERERAKEQL